MHMFVQYEVSITIRYNLLIKISRSHVILDVHILGTKVPICTKYEVSMFKPVVRRAMHRCQRRQANDDAQRTTHNCVGSLAFMPNKSKSVCHENCK